jgi:hypothetical protein
VTVLLAGILPASIRVFFPVQRGNPAIKPT